MLALAPRLTAANLRRPVHFALSYDEELGCFGAPGIIDHIKETGLKPAVALIGEPSRMQVVNGHKGSCGMLTLVTGLTCHSSRPDLGVNAVFHGMDIIAQLRRRAESLAAEPDSIGVFDPPYTTISVGLVRAGAMRNAIPADCRIEWDIRVTRPGLLEAIQSETQAYIEREVLPVMRARVFGGGGRHRGDLRRAVAAPRDGRRRGATRQAPHRRHDGFHRALRLGGRHVPARRACPPSFAALATFCRLIPPTNGSPSRRSRPAWPISTASRSMRVSNEATVAQSDKLCIRIADRTTRRSSFDSSRKGGPTCIPARLSTPIPICGICR